MRPEVVDTIKKLNRDPHPGVAPVEAQPEEPASQQKESPEQPPQSRCERRSLFVFSMPARWIRWSCATLALAALCFVQVATAAENPSAFDAANQLSAEGKPAEAARTLEGIIAKQGYSAPVLFNLANAQLRAGDAGQAVLNYERAHALSPADSDIAANLRLAHERTRTTPTAASPLRFTDWITMNGWAGIGTGALLLVAATLPLALLVPRWRPVLRLARILAVVGLLSSLVAIGARWGELKRAVVTAKAADARISPVTVGPPIFTLPEGTVVSIEKSHGSFALVSAGNGQRGWVNRDIIEPVIRPAS
jgi:hypothetical protein